MGKEYIVMFPATKYSVVSVQLMISVVRDAVVALKSPFPGVNRRVNVSSAHGSIINLPKEIVQSGNAIEKKGVLVTSTADMFVSGLVQSSSNTGDAYAAIPLKNLGKSYLYVGNTKSFLSIVALDDDTNVNISVRDYSPEPYSDKTYSNGDVIQIYLSSLSTFQLFGNDYLLNVKIESDKVVGVISGSTCYSMYQGSSSTYCNTFLSYIPPNPFLGSKFIVPHISLSNFTYLMQFSDYSTSSTYKITGKDYKSTGTLKGFTGSTFKSVPYIIETGQPSVVTQYPYLYLSSAYPSQTLIPALSQYSNNYKFITPTVRSFDSYATIIAKTDDVSGLRFDGKTIYSMKSDIIAIADKTILWNVISLNITGGQHEVKHVDENVSFGLVIQGFASGQSYGFPAGLRLGVPQNCSAGT